MHRPRVADVMQHTRSCPFDESSILLIEEKGFFSLTEGLVAQPADAPDADSLQGHQCSNADQGHVSDFEIRRQSFDFE